MIAASLAWRYPAAMLAYETLKRPVYLMPDFVRQALLDAGLEDDYASRPAYQRNDYIGWITRAKTMQTREKRLEQMLDELRSGGIYMKMKHQASAKR